MSSSVTLTPPQPPLEWKDQPAGVLDKTHELIKKSRSLQDTIAALESAQCNFDTVFKALSLHEAEVDNQSEPLSFYQNVSPDEKLRDASNDAEKLLRDFGIESSMQFYIWDYRYYDTRFVEKTLSLDDAKVKEYFPVDVVVPTILKIYQDLLGVDFVEMKDADTWHQEVQLFQVWNKGATTESEFLGYTYLDLFPREAKYPHAAVWPIVQGYTKQDGTRNYPVTAMVANLAKPLPGKPATMRHDDVVTFFHEMGHVFHGLLSRTEFSRFHGTSVARDFVEAPSQMLENWCWEPQVLKKMSSHFETKEPLSDDLIQKLIQR
ncbi:hypothetical protein FRB98_000687 [Tulasnella sp. 332]|nr:hypothetical protein FRB98_000687 [Tulasnella sp. 332]